MNRLVLAVCLFISSLAAAQPAEPVPKETTLTVTGTGRVERAPNYVDVVVGIETDDKAAASAQASAEKTMSQTSAAIGKLSLPGLDLRTGSVDLGPRYDRRDSSEDIRHIVGYRATITMRVRTTDLHAVSRIIDAALSAGANRVDSVEFGIKEALEARQEAIRLAGKAAKNKAQTLAESLELRLGRVVTASTQSNQYGNWNSNRMAQLANSSAGGESEESVVPGTIEVYADVTVTYAAADGAQPGSGPK